METYSAIRYSGCVIKSDCFCTYIPPEDVLDIQEIDYTYYKLRTTQYSRLWLKHLHDYSYQPHNLEGPAVVSSYNGFQTYFIYGKRIPAHKFPIESKILKELEEKSKESGLELTY